MECTFERGDCPVCGQHRVLGRQLPRAGDDFRCCACIDEYGEEAELEHGDGHVAEDPLSCGSSTSSRSEADHPTNWWATSEPPASLAQVQPEYLEVEYLTVRRGGRAERLTAVTDPVHHFFSGHGADRVWPASLALARLLLAWFSSPGGTRGSAKGLRVVELGAGSGLPGILLARLGARVTLTDVPTSQQGTLAGLPSLPCAGAMSATPSRSSLQAVRQIW